MFGGRPDAVSVAQQIDNDFTLTFGNRSVAHLVKPGVTELAASLDLGARIALALSAVGQFLHLRALQDGALGFGPLSTAPAFAIQIHSARGTGKATGAMSFRWICRFVLRHCRGCTGCTQCCCCDEIPSIHCFDSSFRLLRSLLFEPRNHCLLVVLSCFDLFDSLIDAF